MMLYGCVVVLIVKQQSWWVTFSLTCHRQKLSSLHFSLSDFITLEFIATGDQEK